MATLSFNLIYLFYIQIDMYNTNKEIKLIISWNFFCSLWISPCCFRYEKLSKRKVINDLGIFFSQTNIQTDAQHCEMEKFIRNPQYVWKIFSITTITMKAYRLKVNFHQHENTPALSSSFTWTSKEKCLLVMSNKISRRRFPCITKKRIAIGIRRKKQ